MSINHLPDDLLSKNISLAATAATAPATAAAESTSELGGTDNGQTGETNFTDIPNFSNLAVVCKRWLFLMTTLRVPGAFKSDSPELRGTEKLAMALSAPTISAPALFRTLALAPSVTALSLEAYAVDIYDDEFMSSLLSARPRLARLSIGSPRFTGTPHFRIGTESVENFFCVASLRLEELSLHECLGHTTKLPASIASLSSLRVFHLCSKVLRSLPDEICQLSALQELYLTCALLQQLPGKIGQLTRLEHLSFTGCKEMRRLPDSLGDLSSLTSLHIDGAWQVDRLPPRIGALQQMRRLDLRNFRGGLPEACENWAKLEQVNLASCTDMRSCQLASVHSLTHLTISACRELQSLPANLPFATALRHLTLDHLGFNVSLEPLSGLVALERLHVSSVDREERFHEVLFALPSLVHVKLRNVGWFEPPDVTDMENLREVAAAADTAAATDTAAAAAATFAAAGGGAGDTTYHAELGPSLKNLSIGLGRTLEDMLGGASDADAFHRNLPPCLPLLTSLTNLHLHNMYLPLSPPLAFARLRALRTLRIEYDITFPSHVSFPEDLGQLSALEWLELKYCSISPRLPQSLCDLGSLRRLYLGSKTLKHLPTEISRLSHLQELMISWCYRMEFLPPGLGSLGALQKLSISGASGDYLPDTLAGLSFLEEVSLDQCYDGLIF
ncbi:unnamed protein product [Closterium sp. NIES-65]|nr:unnamed protein product [Closterium sp. NIES-65]